MNNYTTLSENELDREIAIVIFPNAHIVESDEGHLFMDFEPFDYQAWNPSRNADQIQRYVLPRLQELGKNKLGCSLTVHLHWNDAIFKVLINYHTPVTNLVPPKSDWQISFACHSITQRDDINKTILIAALKALDKIKEMEKN